MEPRTKGGIVTVARALIADDSRVFRAWMGELLRERSLEVLEAANGREALDLLLGQRPALVVLDALMPLLSGFDVLTKMREKVPDYKPVVFMVTAVYKSRRWEAEARQQHQVQEYLEKPIEEATILAALNRHLPDLFPSAS
jgi:CheY-like chemotaxis protein